LSGERYDNHDFGVYMALRAAFSAASRSRARWAACTSWRYRVRERIVSCDEVRR
jgi:hypothetical protein